jgi:hypothetical protein
LIAKAKEIEDWIAANPEAETSEYEVKQKEV